MGFLLSWISNPDPDHTTVEAWTRYMSDMGGIAFGLIVLGCALIVLLYHRSATAWKPAGMQQMMGTFTPMRWLWLAILFGVVEGIVCAFNFTSALGREARGEIGVSFEAGLFVLVLTFVIARGIIALVPTLTPEIARRRIR
jgi:hypothetical protein